VIANKIKPKIEKAINKLPTRTIVKRNTINEFGEPAGETIICEVVGLFHEGNSSVTQITKDSGVVKKEKQQFLMVIYNDMTINIKENDLVYMENDKFTIQDLGNQNRMNVYFDLKLRLVK
jgi:uncharacterized protein YneR